MGTLRLWRVGANSANRLASDFGLSQRLPAAFRREEAGLETTEPSKQPTIFCDELVGFARVGAIEVVRVDTVSLVEPQLFAKFTQLTRSDFTAIVTISRSKPERLRPLQVK